MTALWFGLAVLTAFLGLGLVFLDKRLSSAPVRPVPESEHAHVPAPPPPAWSEPVPEQAAQAPAEQAPVAAPAAFAEPEAPVPAPAEQIAPAAFHPPAPATVPASPAQRAPAAFQPPADASVPPGSTIHYESHVHNYNAPVYNGPVYNGPVYIENAHAEDTALEASGRRKGIFDRLVKAERQKRHQWANERGFEHQASDAALVHRWRRGVFAARKAKAARAIVRAETDIGILEFFDVDDLVAIAALHTEHPSSVLVELRAGWSGPPVLSDVSRVGELGGYEVYASDVGAGQRFLWDPRLEGFIARLPQFVRVLWNEGPWVLAELPLDIPDADLDGAAVVVRELADLLRVLPPELDPDPVDRQGFDPGAPQGQLPRRAGRA